MASARQPERAMRRLRRVAAHTACRHPSPLWPSAAAQGAPEPQFSVPTIDLSRLRGSAAEREALAAELRACCHDGAGFFSFEDAEIKGATPPDKPPTGANEWRRPFWLMRILRASMQHGGYLTPDGTVFVPRRLWVQKGARFIGLAAKVECVQCLLPELQRIAAVDYRDATAFERQLTKLTETLDALQYSLHRLLPFVPEPKHAADAAGATSIAKLTERFKGLAKALDKTAARLGALPTKCADSSEYVTSLVQTLEAAEPVETWIEHYKGKTTPLLDKLHRVATFLYEVLCAFILQDLDGLMQRHLRKAALGLIKGLAAEG